MSMLLGQIGCHMKTEKSNSDSILIARDNLFTPFESIIYTIGSKENNITEPTISFSTYSKRRFNGKKILNENSILY